MVDVCCAGIPPHIDPAELVVTWRLRTHAEMFSSSDGNALEPVSQSDTVTSQHYEQYGQQSDDAGTDAGCMFTELLSAAELATSSAQQVQRPSEPQNGLMSCIMPSGIMYPNSGPPASMPFINQNGQLVFLPPAPTNAANVPLLQPPPLSCADSQNLSSSSVSRVSTTQCSETAGEVDSDMPAVSSSTEEHADPPTVSVPEETGLVMVEPADSSVAELSSVPVDSASTLKTESPDGNRVNSEQSTESASCLDGIEPVSPADDVPDEKDVSPSIGNQASTIEQPLFASTHQSSVLNAGVVQQQQPAQFASQPQVSAQQPFATHQQTMPVGMMPTVQNESGSSSMQGTLVLHNGQLLLVNQNQPPVGNSQPLPSTCGVNALGPNMPQNMAVSGTGTIFVNQFPPQPPQQQPAIAPPMPPLGPNQTVMVNTPAGPMTLNTVPSQPNQHPSALILPNGQIVPVVTQPNLLFPPQQCTPVTGGLLIPTPPSQPMVNFVPPVSASPRMSSFTTTPMPSPVVTVAAGSVPGVRGLVQVPAGQQAGFPGTQPVQVGPGSVIQAVPAQGHMPVQMSSQSTVVSSATTTAAGPCASVPNLPQTVMATMTPEGTIILTMPQAETLQKTGGKTKKSTVPRPLMPKPTVPAVKTDGLTSSCSVATTALNFLTPARLPAIAPPTSNIMPMVSGATYVVTNGPSVAGPNISLAPLPAMTNNSSIAPLAISLATDMVSPKNIEAVKTTDILAKATESIFMLSPSSGDHLSPSGLCLSASENQLQIDVEGTADHAAQAVRPNRSRSRSKKKSRISVSLPAGHIEEISADHAAAHSILDQLDGGEGDDEQSDINDFSDLIRLDPMTPRPAVSVAKETSVEESASKTDTSENSVDDTVEIVESCSAMVEPVVESDVPLQDSDDEEVVEIDLTEEPVSPETHVVDNEEPELPDVESAHVVVNEEPALPDVEPALPDVELLPPDVEPSSVNSGEREPLSSSSKTLFERLEEALLSSSSVASSSSSLTSSVSTTLTANTSTRKSLRNLEKSASTMTESSRGNEMNTADKCYSSSVIDRIGKVLTIEKKSRGAEQKNRKLLSTSDSIKEDKQVAECRAQSIVSTSTPIDQSNSVDCVTFVDSSNISVNISTADADKSASEPVTEKRHRRSKKSKEKPSEPVVTALEHIDRAVEESELFEQSISKKFSVEADASNVDGKHKGFALSNFLPESTKLSDSTSAADLLEQSLCMATDDRQKTAKSRSLNVSADESEDVVISDRTFESAEPLCTMEECTQTARKELKKEKSKKQSHKSSCNGIAASEMPDTLTFNATDLLNIVDVVESMAVETQTEKSKKSHSRKHKTSSISSGEVEVPSKRKKKNDSSTSKHENTNSEHVERSCIDSADISAGEREQHSKYGTDKSLHCPRAAMAPKNNPMDVFDFTADDIVPLDVVSSYSPYRNTTKKLADESSQSHINTAKLPAAKPISSSVGDKLPNNKASRLSEPVVDGQNDLSKIETVQSENKENHGTRKTLGHSNDDADVIETAPQKQMQTADMADLEDSVSTVNSDGRSSDEVISKSVTARHSNIATLARHVVPPKMHGSTPRSATKLSAQTVRSRNEPEVGDSASDVIDIPSPKVPAKNADPVQRLSSPVNELSCTVSQDTVNENIPHFDNPSFSDLPHEKTIEPLQALEASKSVETVVGCKTSVPCTSVAGTVPCTSVASTSVVLSCQSDTVVTSPNLQVTVTLSSSSGSSLSQVATAPALPSTTTVMTVHPGSAVSSCAVSRSESLPYAADRNNPVRSCSHESSGAMVDVSTRSCAKNSMEMRENIATGYVNIDETVPGRSSSVGNQSDSMKRRSADTASYDPGPVDRGYCENYSAGEVAVRSRSSGGSCSVEGHSVSTAHASLHCDRAVNSASVSSLNSSSSLRSNCSQKISNSSEGRNSRSSGASQVGGMYSSNMDCSAGAKHRSSCQEDSRQRQMIESDFFAPRAASSSSCAVQSKIATSVIEPFQYPYAAMNGAQPQPHHHEMSLASIAAAEYGFARNPFSSFPSPFGFDPQTSIRGPPGRFSPLSHNLPSCGVDKQTHKSAAGNSMRSGHESSTEMSKSRHHQQQVRKKIIVNKMFAVYFC